VRASRRGILFSSSPKLLLVNFLYGWDVEEMVVLGVIVEDWELFSLAPLPFYL
jgi:hypothetical protein